MGQQQLFVSEPFHLQSGRGGQGPERSPCTPGEEKQALEAPRRLLAVQLQNAQGPRHMGRPAPPHCC